MPSGPRLVDVPRLRTALKVYRVSAAITGTFLLLLVVMMVFRYIFLVDIELNGAYGFLALTPKEQITGINLSIVILTVHGWLYVLYLACDFIMWRLARFSFGRFLFIALGGIIPFLSYYFEFQVPRYIEARIANATDAAKAAEEVRA
jgi:integral membrane protein